MTWLFSSAIMLSSCLLFLVQPMCAKMLLPFLGGAPAVWNTCMVFFQFGLLLGYAYAHFAPRWLGIGWQALLHLFLLVSTYFTLPIHFPEIMAEDWHPVLWLLGTLLLHLGLPFALIAASGPLLQQWFVCKTRLAPRDPYFLYAASNVGSFLALGIFPLVLERFFSLPRQSELWTLGFLALTGLLAFCVPSLARTEPLRATRHAPLTTPPSTTHHSPLTTHHSPLPNRWQCTCWVVLAMIPSSLFLSVTSHITTDIAAIPLLWVIPMGVYLLTFVLVFATVPPIPQTLLLRWLPLVVVVLVLVMLSESADPMLLVMGLHLLGLFWLAMVCHGELARTRPAAEHLTVFYLCLAGGGVLGGMFNALIAPAVFSGLYEYPLMIVLACLLGRAGVTGPTRQDAAWALGLGGLTTALVLLVQSSVFVTLEPGMISVAAMFGIPLLICYMLQSHSTRFALSLGAVLLASGFYNGIHGAVIYRERSYFGIHRVTQAYGFRNLIHGNTIHGQQSVDPDRRREPLAYYSKQGPIGDIFLLLKDDSRLQRVGVIGLGTGTLAAYADVGQHWTFFEIDPTVRRIGENPKLFTFLADARARATIDVEMGDARLQMQKSTQKFGILVVDAFGSDAIPMHLLTREALRIYLDHLQAEGMLAFHISNRYVDLEPVLTALAADADERPPLSCLIREDRDFARNAAQQGIMPSVWLVIARNANDFQPLMQSSRWRPARARSDVKAWTDDYSNLLQVFRWMAAE